jgi:hypothetical protein
VGMVSLAAARARGWVSITLAAILLGVKWGEGTEFTEEV